MLDKILKYKLFRKFGFPRMLPNNLTISLTGQCNSLCKTCFIGRNFRKNPKIIEDELKLEEYGKIFKGLGKGIDWIIFSGGEPFLKKDFLEIVKESYLKLKPKIIVIPTNCLLGEKIVKDTEEILEFCKKSKVTINLSLDGVKEKHDKIRGIKGNFDKFLKVYNDLKRLNYKNLELGIHTVISKYNFEDIEEIYNFVKELKPDEYITEIAEERVELSTVGKKITPSYDEYSNAIDFLIKKIKKEKLSLKQRFRLEYYKLVKEWLKSKEQILPCYAGWASAQIQPNGDVWLCCVKGQKIGNLRESGYDFRKIWFSKKAYLERKKVKNRECSCPLASANYNNILFNNKSLFRISLGILKT